MHLLADVTSLVSRLCVQLVLPTERTTHNRNTGPGIGGSRCNWLSATWRDKDQPRVCEHRCRRLCLQKCVPSGELPDSSGLHAGGHVPALCGYFPSRQTPGLLSSPACQGRQFHPDPAPQELARLFCSSRSLPGGSLALHRTAQTARGTRTR